VSITTEAGWPRCLAFGHLGFKSRFRKFGQGVKWRFCSPAA